MREGISKRVSVEERRSAHVSAPRFPGIFLIKRFMLLNHVRVRVQNAAAYQTFKRWHTVKVFELVFCESTCYQCEMLPNYNDCDAQCAEAVLRL